MEDFADDIAAIGRIDVVPRILEVVCRTTGMGFAAVARVTEDRWIACAVRDEIAFGLAPGGELELGTTICNEIRQSGRPVLIDHVAEDDLYRDHHTPRLYGIQSSVSVPILRRGTFFGTLCAIDPGPASVKSPEIRGMFELFADLIAQHLAIQDDLHAEREVARLREQFIAILGHDLRNPLAAIEGGVRLLRKTPLDERATTLVGMMDKSVVRMTGLIDSVLDLARGRLGGGIKVDQAAAPDLQSTLEQVVAELRAARPDRAIEVDMALSEPVSCDSRRIAQLFSNLLANALSHGAQDAPVAVTARSADGWFELSVANPGEPIEPKNLKDLFEPFARTGGRTDSQGLGLGLYIAREIATAHNGALTVASDPGETRFTFRMPTA